MVTEPETTAMEALIDAWAAAVTAHDLERFVALFTDDLVYDDVALGDVSHGKAALRAFYGGYFARMPDLSVEVTSTLIVGNRAALEGVWRGTHTVDWPGLPATGRQFAVRFATILEVENGKIKRNTDYADATTILRQLGA